MDRVTSGPEGTFMPVRKYLYLSQVTTFLLENHFIVLLEQGVSLFWRIGGESTTLVL
jgi:hypothetical protein